MKHLNRNILDCHGVKCVCIFGISLILTQITNILCQSSTILVMILIIPINKVLPPHKYIINPLYLIWVVCVKSTVQSSFKHEPLHGLDRPTVLGRCRPSKIPP